MDNGCTYLQDLGREGRTLSLKISKDVSSRVYGLCEGYNKISPFARTLMDPVGLPRPGPGGSQGVTEFMKFP